MAARSCCSRRSRLNRATPRLRWQRVSRPPSTSSIRARSAGSRSGASPGATAQRGSTAGGSMRPWWRISVQQRATDRRARGIALAAVLSLTGLSVAAADELKPFQASYAWNWHGMNVAISTLKLEHTGDTWTYTSKSEPRGIGKVFSERPTQKSVLRVTDEGTQPLSYAANDGTSSAKRTVDVKYDWEQKR